MDTERQITMDEYQRAAVTTAVYRDEVERLAPVGGNPQLNQLIRIFYAGLGLGEAGEVQNKLKKILRDSQGQVTEEMHRKLGEELGGLLWYVAALADELGLPLSMIANRNLEVLASRAKRGVIRGSGDDR